MTCTSLACAVTCVSSMPVFSICRVAQLSCCVTSADLCLLLILQKGVVDTQLIAHDKEVYDIAWGGVGVFASVSADGSVRVFDLRYARLLEKSEPRMRRWARLWFTDFSLPCWSLGLTCQAMLGLASCPQACHPHVAPLGVLLLRLTAYHLHCCLQGQGALNNHL